MRQPRAASSHTSLLTLMKGLEIMEVLSTADIAGLTHGQLADLLGYRRSTLYRYLASLEAAGFVESIGETRYRLGQRAATLASADARRRAFRRLAQRSVVHVSTLVGEPVHATVFADGYSLTVAAAPASSRMDGVLGVGSRRPAHRSASGLLFLALSPDSVAGPFVEKAQDQTEAEGGRPLTSRLASIRQGELGTDESKCMHGVSCMAAPVFDYTDRIVGSVSLTVTAPANLRSAMRAHERSLRQGARALSALLGHDPDSQHGMEVVGG